MNVFEIWDRYDHIFIQQLVEETAKLKEKIHKKYTDDSSSNNCEDIDLNKSIVVKDNKKDLLVEELPLEKIDYKQLEELRNLFMYKKYKDKFNK